jgi:ABC-type antimicrobial peptide transport system permease subunit
LAVNVAREIEGGAIVEHVLRFKVQNQLSFPYIKLLLKLEVQLPVSWISGVSATRIDSKAIPAYSTIGVVVSFARRTTIVEH